MSNAKFVRDMHAHIGDELRHSALRGCPVMVSDHRNLLEELTRLVLAYEPRDLRLDANYRAEHEVLDLSSAWAVDVCAGARLRECNRMPSKNTLVVALDVQSNMADFERYNSVVRDHNERWEAEGCPTDSFDPWSGDIIGVEQYVDFAVADEEMPVMGDKSGSLFRARPGAKRSELVTVEYRVSASDRKWTLGFVATDREGRAVCWDEESGIDLASLVRRSVQKLYGNQEVRGNEGALSEGLTMLVQGRKVPWCKHHAHLPSWALAKAKDTNPALAVAKVEEIACDVTYGVSGYILPVLCLVGMFVWAAMCLIDTWHANSDVAGPLAGFWCFAGGEVGILAVMWISTAFSTRAKRSAEASRMRQSFL